MRSAFCIPSLRSLWALVLVTVMISGPAMAQSGKIAGRVVEASGGGPLPGVNVIVTGTTLGSATDANGEYFIIGVPPGNHTLRVTMVGFRDVVIEGVRVQSGLTTPVDVRMEEAAFELDQEVVVTATRPVIQKDETSSIVYLDIQQIAAMPVTSARDALMLQSGVFFDPEPIIGGLGGSGRGEQRYAVRGGDQTEVTWFIDGVRAAALVEGRADRGGSFTNVNMHAVQEIQLLTGGFNAEFGNAQSGIVNVVTKEGGRRYSGSMEYIYGQPGQRHFGNYLYDPATQKEFQDHMLEDGTLDPEWWNDERRSQTYDYRALADHHLYASLGGPLVRIGSSQSTFFIASQFRREAYVFPRPRDHRELDDVLVNVATQVRSNMKLKLSGMYSRTGHSTLQENGDFTGQVKYYRGWGSITDDTHYLGALHWTHTLSPSSYYTLRLSTYLLDMQEKPSEFTRLGRSQNPDIWGFQRFNGFPTEPFDGWSFIYDQHQQVGDVSLDGAVNWQVNNANFLKAGFEARYNTYREIESYRYPSFTTDQKNWINRGLGETYHPIQIAGYVQDKMEFRSMILNVGLRYDYFNPNYDWFTSRDIFNLSADPEFDPALDPDGDQIDANGRVKYSFENVLTKPREPAPATHTFSPRLGVSFPVSDRSVLHFNYGHFYQMPPLDRMFEFGYFRPLYLIERGIAEEERAAAENRPPAHIASNDGDPERVVVLTLDPLKPEKTISFEVGLTHNFSDWAVLDVTGFYKDVFDKVLPRQGLFDRTVFMYDPFRGTISPNIGFSTNLSGDYGDARGFEINLRTLFSPNATLNTNYSFSRFTEGRATPGTLRYDRDGNPSYTYDVDVNKRLPAETTFSRPHILRANLFLKYPDLRRRSVIGAVLRGTTLSALFRYVSGRTFTYVGPDDPPDTRDNHRFPAIRQLDMRLEKTVAVGSDHGFTAYANVSNVLNTRNLRSFGDMFFDANAVKRYVEEGEISEVDAGGYDLSWQNYFPPRQIWLGFRYNFR